MLQKVIAIAFIGCIVVACSKKLDLNPSTDLGTYFYPITKGKFVIYDVSKIKYSFSSKNDTQIYQLKEVVGDTFTDLEGNIGYALLRYKRYYTNKSNLSGLKDSSWTVDSVWNFRSDNFNTVVFESNTPYIKLSYPIELGKSWNGNALNTKKIQNFKISKKGIKINFGDIVVDNVIEVTQSADSNALERNIVKEKYGQDIGLVFIEKRIFDDACKYNFENKPCVPGAKIASGIIYSQKIIAHGFEKP
ncbi:MAG: hypothetical protein SFY32_01180 [Bacteroidota bacterium]|nr:hypothetical protein [Bacteroidota bacterium]